MIPRLGEKRDDSSGLISGRNTSSKLGETGRNTTWLLGASKGLNAFLRCSSSKREGLPIKIRASRAAERVGSDMLSNTDRQARGSRIEDRGPRTEARSKLCGARRAVRAP